MTKKISELAEKEIPPYLQPGFDFAASKSRLQAAMQSLDDITAILDELDQADNSGNAHEDQ